MHGLMVTNKQVCVFGVLIGGDDFRIYRVERDEETIQAILERGRFLGPGEKPEPS